MLLSFKDFKLYFTYYVSETYGGINKNNIQYFFNNLIISKYQTYFLWHSITCIKIIYQFNARYLNLVTNEHLIQQRNCLKHIETKNLFQNNYIQMS